MTSPRGFTLIELLVVIAIIGIMSSVVLASLNVARNRANDSKRKGDVNQLVKAIGNHYNDRGNLPGTSGMTWCSSFQNATNAATFAATMVPTYTSQIPHDPVHRGAEGDYFYAKENNNSGKYTVCAALEQDPAVDIPDFTGCPGWSEDYNYCVTQ